MTGRVRRSLLAWYAREHRDFPWRGSSDPYQVLVSEVMLQQTQASRVSERFRRFMSRFPSVEDLACAPTSDVLAEWSGLGYNRRAVALQRTAAIVAAEGWPRDVAGLARLPGIGPYTSRAIASIALGIPVGVVDTNVRRWLLRRFDGTDRPAALQSVADALAAPGVGADIAAWTHTSMEFGANVCRSRAPRCDACPISVGCPSRGVAERVAVPRQPALRGSNRAYRGEVLRLLAAAVGHELSEASCRAELAAGEPRVGPRLDASSWLKILAGLERDELVHRSGGMLRLGAATIGE